MKSLTLFKFVLLTLNCLSIQNRQENMNRQSVKLIKQHQRVPEHGPIVKLAVGPNRWSTAVRSWVVDFLERERSESLPAFDSLFNDAPLQTENAD